MEQIKQLLRAVEKSVRNLSISALIFRASQRITLISRLVFSLYRKC